MLHRHLSLVTAILLLYPTFKLPLSGGLLGTSDVIAQTPTTEQQRAILRGNADKLYVQGEEALRQGLLQKALSNFQQVLAIRSELGDRSGVADTLLTIGDTYSRMNQLDRSQNYYRQALAIYTEIGDRNGELNAKSKLNAIDSTSTITPQLPANTPTQLNAPSNNGNDRTQLPWILVTQNRDRTVPPPIIAKISALLNERGLTSVSCSASSAVIVAVNNLYVACASPTPNFPPGNYSATIPDL